jgi:hypothetical protein
MGIWGDTLVVTTRDFDENDFYAGVSVLAIDTAPLYLGSQLSFLIFFIDRAQRRVEIGDGLLPADVDGNVMPDANAPILICGTRDNGGYGGPDGINVWELQVDWSVPLDATLQFVQVLAVDPVDTIFPCSPTARECIPQPSTSEKLDILSYRQRPLHRLAYRRFIDAGGNEYESFVTNQSVEARVGIAGVR